MTPRCLAPLALRALLVPARGAAPPARLTAGQAGQLKERDRLLRWAERRDRLGRYAEALPFAARALELTRAVRGDLHPEVADALGRLALLCELAGEWGEAVKHREAAVSLRGRLNGPGHWRATGERMALRFVRKAAALGKAEREEVLAALGQEQEAQRQVDAAQAERLLARVVRVYRKLLGGEDAAVARVLFALGRRRYGRGDRRGALRACREALAIYRQALPEGHPDIARSLNNLGAVQRDLGSHKEALESHREALAIRRQALPEGHPHIARSLTNVGNVQRDLGRHNEALRSHEEALTLFRKALPEGHPDIARSLSNLAVAVIDGGTDRQRALAWLKEAAGIYQRHLSRLALAQAEAEQLRAAARERHALDLFVALAGEDRAEEAFSLVVSSKGAVTARQRWARQTREADPRSAALLQELRRANLELLRSSLDERPDRGGGRVDANAEVARLREVGQRRDRLEEELARRSAAYRRLLQQGRRGAAEVRAALPEGSALIDFLEYWHASGPAKGKTGLSWERRLLAFVVRPGKDKAALVRLGGTQRLGALIDEWRASHGSGKKPTVGKADPAVALRRELWLPLEKHLKGARVVLVSPDGPLNGLPLAALPGAKPGTFLVQEYAFAVVPVPQLLPELLAPRRRQGQPRLLLVGGIDFGKGRPAAKGALPSFKELPGTESEVNDLRTRFEDAFPDAPAPRRLRKDNATRAAFLREAPKPRFVHVATHGYFAPASEPSALAAASRGSLLEAGDLRRAVVGRHPALLSGLVFAGVNDAAKRDEAILNALEAAELRLEGAELVTLSACDTGRGAVAGGEGVLGLQRAFALAGARSVVASLWKVPDEPTHQLMREFYRRVWSDKPLARAEALRQAQVWMLNNYDPSRGGVRLPEKGKGPLAPYYWAAFVLSGDWR
jgi:CHAT domain-containing protein/tetratricopeptide (TPR) repeat protein